MHVVLNKGNQKGYFKHLKMRKVPKYERLGKPKLNVLSGLSEKLDTMPLQMELGSLDHIIKVIMDLQQI